MDEWTWIRKLGILKVRLDSVGVINVGIAADAFSLLELSQHACTLDVFEVHNWVLRKVDDSTEVVIQTFRGLGILKHLDKLFRTEFLVIFLSNFHTDLHVRWATGHHVLEQSNALFSVQLPKVGDNKLGVHLMAIFEDTLDVINVRVMLRSTLPHACTFAQLAHMGTVVVCKNSILHNGIGNLRRATDKVDLKQLGLKVGVLLLVILEGLEQEGGSFLDAIA
mmetsp:Transcript_4630/g.10475  ORF Transcript_4630/g.10475 Transcript_4630/m.10475 type:complete len:222 (-) Transcript_4630:1758-2423(-)